METKKCSEWALLTAEELAIKMSALPLWSLYYENEVPKIERKFVTKGFQAGLDALSAAGAIAERLNHHPDFHLTGYNNVRIVIYTHSLSGLTELDLQLASTIDNEVKVLYSPKFLRENPAAMHTALEIPNNPA